MVQKRTDGDVRCTDMLLLLLVLVLLLTLLFLLSLLLLLLLRRHATVLQQQQLLFVFRPLSPPTPLKKRQRSQWPPQASPTTYPPRG